MCWRGVLCRFDVALFEGVLPNQLGAPAGHEAVGTVREVGDGVAGLRVGDVVSLIGEAGGEPYFARRVNVSTSVAARLPEVPSKPELWIAEPVVCVASSLALSAPRAGDRVALVGAGFMGCLFLQGPRQFDLGDLLAVELMDDRLTLARQLGARAAKGRDTGDMAELAAELGEPFEMVIETGGTRASLDLAFELVAPAVHEAA